jgi:hypothetical protein
LGEVEEGGTSLMKLKITKILNNLMPIIIFTNSKLLVLAEELHKAKKYFKTV